MTNQLYTSQKPDATQETPQSIGKTSTVGTTGQKVRVSRAPKIPTLRIPLGYLYQRILQEAASTDQDPNGFALAVVLTACGLRNPVANGGVDLVSGDQIHPRSPLMLVSGSLVGAVQAAAKKHHTCVSRFIGWHLGLALEEPYQRSVFEII